MSASVHGEGGRPGLRRLLAFLMLLDLIGILNNFFLVPPPDMRVPWTPGWLLTIGDMVWPILVLATLMLGGILGFARGKRAQLWFGLVTLLCMGVLVESMGAHLGEPRRRFYSTGATLSGWLVGLVLAWFQGAEDERSERLAEAGAAAGLVVTYANAGLQKLGAGGLFEAHTFQAHIFTHHHIDDSSVVGMFARFVAIHPNLAVAIAVSVVVVQGGSWIFLVSRRGRMIWGTVLVSFHLGTLIFLHIIYIQATILLLGWAFPWKWMVARVRARASIGPLPEAPEDEPVPAALMAKFVGVGALFVAIIWQLPTPRELPMRSAQIDIPEFASVESSPVEEVARVGPFGPDDELGGWTIVALGIDPGRRQLVLELARGQERVRMKTSGPGGETPEGPLSRDSLHLTLDPAPERNAKALEPAVDAMVERLVAEGEEPAVALDRWIAEAPLR